MASVPICASVPIRASPAHNDLVERVPPICLNSHFSALSLVSPPIEEGERCHVCEKEARCLANRYAWCDQCVTAMFKNRGISVFNPVPKVVTSNHAMRHAFQWYGLLSKLLRSVIRGNLQVIRTGWQYFGSPPRGCYKKCL